MVAYDSSNEWVQAQNALWRELAGSTVTRWIGLDTNIGSDDELDFVDASSPYRVLGALRLERGASPALDFDIYQNEDRFGLSLEVSEGRPQPRSDWDRDSDLSDLPVGPIERLEAHLDDTEGNYRDLIEVQLTIGAREVLVVAAEVFPTWTEPKYGWGEEDFFVFTDPAAANEVAWSYPRQFVTRQVGPGRDGGEALGS